MKDIRGNIDTRLRKLAEGGYDALVLAEAGLRRLGLDRHIAQVLPWEIVLPAPGQGAMALETRADDEPTRRIAAELDHPPTRAAVTAERTLLAALQGGCLAPVAALGRIEGDRLTLVGRVLSRDGARRIEAADSAAARRGSRSGSSRRRCAADSGRRRVDSGRARTTVDHCRVACEALTPCPSPKGKRGD